VLSTALIFREVFSAARYAGTALVLGGLAVIVLPTHWTRVLNADRGRH
jgi:drug/metabolite transporter (DMT)-like permease